MHGEFERLFWKIKKLTRILKVFSSVLKCLAQCFALYSEAFEVCFFLVLLLFFSVVCVCVRACVHACMCVRVYASACVRVPVFS